MQTLVGGNSASDCVAACLWLLEKHARIGLLDLPRRYGRDGKRRAVTQAQADSLYELVAKGQSQEDAALAVGISTSVASHILTGKHRLSRKQEVAA